MFLLFLTITNDFRLSLLLAFFWNDCSGVRGAWQRELRESMECVENPPRMLPDGHHLLIISPAPDGTGEWPFSSDGRRLLGSILFFLSFPNERNRMSIPPLVINQSVTRISESAGIGRKAWVLFRTSLNYACTKNGQRGQDTHTCVRKWFSNDLEFSFGVLVCVCTCVFITELPDFRLMNCTAYTGTHIW